MSQNNVSLLSDAGIPDGKGAGVALVYTEWNDPVVSELVGGCENMLQKYHIGSVVKMQVPGAIEIPFTCRRYFDAVKKTSYRPDAIIALGCVIRGDTPHFDYVCRSVTQGVTELNLLLPVPVIFGVLTVDNIEQAKARTGGTHGHKGEEAAVTALKMIALNKKLS